MARQGIGYVTEDRKGEGIIKDMNLRENMTLPSLEFFETFFYLNKYKEKNFVKDYIKNLESSGHNTQYWEYEGRSHAFLDSGSNFFIGSSFEENAPQAIDVMINFLDSVFYP